MQRATRLFMAALVLGACSKGEPESRQAKPNAPVEAPAPRAGGPAGDASVDEALKERLARQEAAARMFERNVLQPVPPKGSAPKAPEAPAPEPREAKAAPPAQAAATPPAAAPKAEPAKAEPPKAEAPKTEPPKAAPAKAAPPKAAPSRTDVAAARPTSAPEPAAAHLLSRVEPDFPAEAYRAGVERGTVRARMTIDGTGAVTNVEILDASPRRVFDRAVMRALAQWKFNEGAAGRTVDSEIDFRR